MTIFGNFGDQHIVLRNSTSFVSSVTKESVSTLPSSPADLKSMEILTTISTTLPNQIDTTLKPDNEKELQDQPKIPPDVADPSAFMQDAPINSPSRPIDQSFEKVLHHVDAKFGNLGKDLTELMKLTRDMFDQSNAMMSTVVWLRIANICSAVIAASCIVPVLVIMCRAKV